MNIEQTEVNKFRISDIDNLDPISVFTEDFGKGHGQITIICFGEAWTNYWPGMGSKTITEFFCSCDEHYLANKLSQIDTEVYDIDKLRSDAEKKGVECWRDDAWNDYEFMSEMYGSDMSEWHYQIPRKENHNYIYLCKIIKTVQDGLAQQAACKAA